jgi:hypothetical protein
VNIRKIMDPPDSPGDRKALVVGLAALAMVGTYGYIIVNDGELGAALRGVFFYVSLKIGTRDLVRYANYPKGTK